MESPMAKAASCSSKSKVIPFDLIDAGFPGGWAGSLHPEVPWMHPKTFLGSSGVRFDRAPVFCSGVSPKPCEQDHADPHQCDELCHQPGVLFPHELSPRCQDHPPRP